MYEKERDDKRTDLYAGALAVSLVMRTPMETPSTLALVRHWPTLCQNWKCQVDKGLKCELSDPNRFFSLVTFA